MILLVKLTGRQADGRFLKIGVPMEVLEFRITSSLILEASFLFTRLLNLKKKLRGNILLESSFDWDTPSKKKIYCQVTILKKAEHPDRISDSPTNREAPVPMTPPLWLLQRLQVPRRSQNAGRTL